MSHSDFNKRGSSLMNADPAIIFEAGKTAPAQKPDCEYCSNGKKTTNQLRQDRQLCPKCHRVLSSDLL
jgi:ssDNA-binding Zn-finger/Zn-ribbon topoisomerase 1